jgi:hypothetical protein
VADKTEQELIDKGRRVRAFIDDSAVKDAIRRVNDRYYTEFKAALTAEDRTTAWAKSKALDDLSGELIAVTQNGEIASRVKATRDEHDRLRRSRGGTR